MPPAPQRPPLRPLPRRASPPQPSGRQWLRIPLLMAIIASLWGLWAPPLWSIQEVKLYGLSPHTHKHVIDYFQKHRIEGKHLLQVNPVRLRDELLQFTLIQDVHIERHLFPPQLMVRVTERKPAFRIVLEQAPLKSPGHVLIDVEGRVLNVPPSTRPDQKLVASLTANKLQKTLDRERLEVLHQLNAHLNAGQLPYPGIYNLDNPQNVILRRPDATTPIWLGKPQDLALKLSLLSPIQQLAGKQREPIEYIDLRFWRHPVLKTRRGSLTLPARN